MKKFEYKRPVVLSIAGFDPTGGAGVLADVKTFEQFKCLGMGIISADTIQVEDQFISVKWKTIEEIKEQCLPILQSYSVKAVKIGIIESTTVLKQVIEFIQAHDSSIQIIWDPVIASSSGFDLLNKPSKEELITVLSRLYLITPNYREYKILSEIIDTDLHLKKALCPVLLKGGHNPINEGTDFLYLNGNEIVLEAVPGKYSPKHGSGCILSSAITAGLASGFSLEDSCKNAKGYIENCLTSNTNLLAYHVA